VVQALHEVEGVVCKYKAQLKPIKLISHRRLDRIRVLRSRMPFEAVEVEVFLEVAVVDLDKGEEGSRNLRPLVA
jgi:hypothetical protein